MKKKDARELREELERRRSALSSGRSAMVGHWKDLQAFINPFRGKFGGERPNQREPDLSKIIDGASMRARRILSAGMQSGLTSPSRQWFKLSTHDPSNTNREIHVWCDEVHERMMKVMAASNFYHAIHGVYDEIATFGTAAVRIEFDFENIIRCHAYTAGTYYVSVDSSDRADTFYEDLWMTASQMAEKFGEDNLSYHVRSALDKNPDLAVEVRHAVERDFSPGARHRFKSVWWEPGSSDVPLLKEGWFDVFPVMVPRWHVVSGDTYGYGPGSESLPDVKMLQKMAKNRLSGVNKQVEPPLVVPANMAGRRVNTYPNGITYEPEGMGDKSLIRPLYGMNFSIQDLSAAIAEVVQSINSNMYVDLFMMLQNNANAQMTAREVVERHEEKMLALGPVLERLEGELLTPAIERIFAIMAEAGQLPPPPAGMEASELKIEYVSILAQAQKMMGLAPIEQFSSFTGNLAAAAPEIMDNVDMDATLREYAELIGLPAKILRDPEAVSSIRAQRQEALAQQEQMAQMERAASMGHDVASGAKLLSEADMGPDSALQALLGGNSGGFGMDVGV